MISIREKKKKYKRRGKRRGERVADVEEENKVK